MSTTIYLSNHPEMTYQGPAIDEQQGIGKAILLHLLPGAAIMLGFALLSEALASWALPALLVFLITGTLVVIPLELGSLLWLGWKRNKRLSLDGIVRYREHLPFKKALWIISLTFVGALALFLLFSFVDGWLYTNLFGWWPAAWDLSLDPTAQPQRMLVISVAALYLVGNLFAPIVEELYFRGYLLPRLSHFGKWAPVINSILFACYHFWSPWNLVSRAFGMLPIAFAVRRNQNIYIGMIVHCALNCIGSIPLLMYALGS